MVAFFLLNLIDLTKRSLTNTEIVKDIKVDYLQDRAIPENTYSRFRFSPDFKLDYEKTIRYLKNNSL